MGKQMPDPRYISLLVEKESRERNRKNVIKFVQAMITGGVDLSPEEMVDAAFLMVERINNKLNGE